MLVAAAIVALYDVVVPRLMPDGGHSADVQQENVIHAQSYLYPRAAVDTVVVGSSKLARLDFSEKSGIFNLAISGQGARTGLELVLRSPARPRRVVIEVGDTLLREPDAAFLSGLFNPVNDRLRRWIPVLRDTYQPGAILNELAKRLGPKSKPVDQPMTPDLYQKVLQAAIDKHTVAPAPEVLARIMTSLQRQLAALRARGAAVYFFEPPEEPQVWNSPQSTRIRQEVERLFPDVPRFPAFPLSGPGSYRTTDGIHLDVASAKRFGAALEAWLATQP
ncbi:MAG TPA: hypothetical protein VIA18_16185 [Polyangia bacterium]|nr:hypothetical protein [Polyangia bacterium]